VTADGHGLLSGPFVGITGDVLPDRGGGPIPPARRVAAVADPYRVVTAVLWHTFAALPGGGGGQHDVPAPLPDRIRGVPIILAADEYCVDVATVFVRRCDQPDRRLRPSDAVRLETSELLRRFALATGWRGDGHVVVSPGRAADQALRLADAMTRALHPAVVVCELYALATPDPSDRGDHPIGPYLIVAAAVAASSDAVPPLAASAGHDPLRRSLLLRRASASAASAAGAAR
jgi:hypothetical protein